MQEPGRGSTLKQEKGYATHCDPLELNWRYFHFIMYFSQGVGSRISAEGDGRES